MTPVTTPRSMSQTYFAQSSFSMRPAEQTPRNPFSNLLGVYYYVMTTHDDFCSLQRSFMFF